MTILDTEGSSTSIPETKRGPLTPPVSTKKRKGRWGERITDLVSNCGATGQSDNIASVIHEDELSQKRYKQFRRGRSSSTCRLNRPTFQRKHNAEWRCLVCYLWNSRSQQCCSRCAAVEGVDKVGGSIRRSEPTSSHRGNHLQRIQPTEFKWPSLFETNGCDYVLDPRSNMFYNQKSDFFYDCNSKLYYSNKKKAYFQRVESPGGATFEKVTGSSGAENSNSPSMVPLTDDSTVQPKKIKIRIRSKSLSLSRHPRSPPRRKGSPEEPLCKRRKEQLQYVEKWGKLSLSSAMALPTADVSSDIVRTITTIGGTLTSTLDMARTTSQAIVGATLVRESSGAGPSQKTNPSVANIASKPICVLCKRKFASLDQLRRHEQQSELHKTNLAKRKAEESTAVTIQNEKPKYEDRAKKRRLLHADLPVSLPTKRIDLSRPLLERAARIDPEFALDQNNVGNQLFHKMVAKSSNSAPEEKPTLLCETIKDDWRRIEIMSTTKTVAKEFAPGKGLGF